MLPSSLIQQDKNTLLRPLAGSLFLSLPLTQSQTALLHQTKNDKVTHSGTRPILYMTSQAVLAIGNQNQQAMQAASNLA